MDAKVVDFLGTLDENRRFTEKIPLRDIVAIRTHAINIQTHISKSEFAKANELAVEITRLSSTIKTDLDLAITASEHDSYHTVTAHMSHRGPLTPIITLTPDTFQPINKVKRNVGDVEQHYAGLLADNPTMPFPEIDSKPASRITSLSMQAFEPDNYPN